MWVKGQQRRGHGFHAGENKTKVRACTTLCTFIVTVVASFKYKTRNTSPRDECVSGGQAAMTWLSSALLI